MSGFGVSPELSAAFSNQPAPAASTDPAPAATPEPTATPATPAAAADPANGGGQSDAAAAAQASADPAPAAADPAPAAAASTAEPSFEERLLAMAAERGRNVTSVDELFKPVEENPYAGVELDDNDKAYLKYKQDTGRSYSDFLKFNEDFSQIGDLDFARDRVRKDTGNPNLTNDEVDKYLQRHLDIADLGELDETDKIALSAFSRQEREAREQEKQKYATPAAKPDPVPGEETVTLENGQVMKKKDYDDFLIRRSQFLEKQKESVDSVAPSVFSFEVDDNGTKRQVELPYDYDGDDKHSMLALAEDITGTIAKEFNSDKGFDMDGYNQAAWWMKKSNREKAISSLAQKAYAKAVEDILTVQNNVNFSRNALDRNAGKNTRTVDVFALEKGNGFGVNFDLPKSNS